MRVNEPLTYKTLSSRNVTILGTLWCDRWNEPFEKKSFQLQFIFLQNYLIDNSYRISRVEDPQTCLNEVSKYTRKLSLALSRDRPCDLVSVKTLCENIFSGCSCGGMHTCHFSVDLVLFFVSPFSFTSIYSPASHPPAHTHAL